MQEVFGVDCSPWELKALRQHLFLDRPPRPIRIPQWDLDKVLALLQTKKFCQQPGKFLLAKKTAFFLALATTNRVSELSAVIRNGKGTIRADAVLRLPLHPGFLFKNQREGRTGPSVGAIWALKSETQSMERMRVFLPPASCPSPSVERERLG